MVLSVGGSFAYFARNAHCTVATDLLCDIPTHKMTSPPGAAIFSLHTLASPSGRNVNYDEKQLIGKKKCLSCSFYLYRFRKYMPYSFPIIIFCNPGVHYEMPCVMYLTAVLFTMVCYVTRHVIHTHTGLQQLQKHVHQLIFLGGRNPDKSISS